MDVTQCNDCKRLRTYCERIGKEKRKAYQNDQYWARPVPAFGVPQPEVVIVGLAPGAHGANRTGRVFTGDRSGEWLYRALHRAGFANQSESTGLGDGLQLKNAIVTCVVKCAPPDNKPTPGEIARCSKKFFDVEIQKYSRARVYIALGQIAFHALWKKLGNQKTRPKFEHGKEIELEKGRLLLSYHPSQQNTFTGRLTEPMFDRIFARANDALRAGPAKSTAELC
jgi:uracil-DNA glycosylase family 4